jgi:hypothetical protein
MTELILSDITRMGGGFCAIGLERDGQKFRSLRPIPPRGFAWPASFAYSRGAVLEFDFAALSITQPHIEDRFSQGNPLYKAQFTEQHLVSCLRKADWAVRLEELFGCPLLPSPHGGPCAWVEPNTAVRSICGCDFINLAFRVFPDRLRADLAWGSGEVLRSLPVVDRDWNRFVEEALRRMQGANRIQRMEHFLNAVVGPLVLDSPNRLARIGLPRPKEGRCWLMLDSLFPQLREEWLEGLI